MAKSTMLEAQSAKKDEFYTTYEDIQKELNYYEKHFEGKTILCNCDDPFESNFCKFFLRNFNYLKLKRLICTSFNSSPVAGTQLSFFDLIEDTPSNDKAHGYVLDVSKVPMANGRGISDEDIDRLLRSKKMVKELKGDGDFRSDECIEYLKQADIVVTNPPFSLFREYVTQLNEYKKKFLVLSNQNAITYKEFFPYLMNNEIWIGYGFNKSMVYKTPYPNKLEANRKFVISKGYNPDEGYVKVPGICWFTNLDIQKRHEKLILYKYYSPEEYPTYDNYDAINVDKVTDIPMDFTGIMGVPITFMDKYNPDQFEILGITDRLAQYGFRTKTYTEADAKNYNDLNRGPALKIDGKFQVVYTRIFIKHKGQ